MAVIPRIGVGQTKPVVYPEFPSQDPNLVREIVGASHNSIEKVRELLAKSPALAKCGYDWGYGDWETALGAATHVGRRDIVALLLENGARPDIFTFTMLGNLEAVKAIVAAQPGIQKSTGPHGITMLNHARAGGEASKPVLDFLESLGDANPARKSEPITEEEQALLIGTYVFGSGADEVFEVGKSSQGILTITRIGRSARNMFRVEEHAFAPIGAPHVRIRFKIENGKAVSLTVHDPMPIVTGIRK